jgi:hypothetical protein
MGWKIEIFKTECPYNRYYPEKCLLGLVMSSDNIMKAPPCQEAICPLKKPEGKE